MRPTLLIVIGTRPEAIKLAPVVRSLRLRGDSFRTVVCATGQHREMLRQVLDVFDLQPDSNLDVMIPGQSLAQLTSSVLTALDNVLSAEQPGYLIVQGDTTTAFVAGLAAYYRRVPVAHVEAGLRTQDKYGPFPEEINRRLISHIADVHFAPTSAARNNLLREGIPKDRILVTGNTVVDALLYTRARLRETPSLARIPAIDGVGRNTSIVLVTAHRRESFGAPMIQICASIRRLAQLRPDVLIVYPVHMNPMVRTPVYQFLSDLPNVKLLEPLDYASFVAAMDRATVILTDSGGVQEEGPTLGKPVLVMRDVSERPEALAAGAARLTGTDPGRIVDSVCALLDDPQLRSRMSQSTNLYGDGNAAVRIAEFFLSRYGISRDNACPAQAQQHENSDRAREIRT